MRFTGRLLSAAMLVIALVGATPALAELTAEIDRSKISLGDVLRLTITATGDEELSELDLRPLESKFELLQRSTSSNTSIVNGKRTHKRQLLIDLAPMAEGTHKIPPMRTGQHVTNALDVTVGPPPDADTEGQSIIFEAELDRQSAYVQGQVILTLRLQQAINLENRSISELKLDNAFVKPLEQQSFQRNRQGRPWLVHEVRYAIFPEQSGSLVIPGQTFSARESQPRRSLFELSGNGRLVRRKTEALTIEVLPRPEEFPATTWLPARKLSIEENWSTPPEQLRAGESATRILRVSAEGLQGAQLPPIIQSAPDGLKIYPDQPSINDAEVASGILGARQESVALVPTLEGNWTIPEIRIPWWDTERGELRYAVVPERTISVAAADPQLLPANATADTTALTGAQTTGASGSGDLIWKAIAGVSSLGWLATIIYMFRANRRRGQERVASQVDVGEGDAFKNLLAACAGDNPAQARRALIAWAGALFPAASLHSLDALMNRFDDQELAGEVAALDQALYRSAEVGDWSGTGLGKCARRLRKQQTAKLAREEPRFELYPEPGRQAV